VGDVERLGHANQHRRSCVGKAMQYAPGQTKHARVHVEQPRWLPKKVVLFTPERTYSRSTVGPNAQA
jgi:hypothetical protein